MMLPEEEVFGPYLLRLRSRRGLSQRELAERSGVVADTIGRLENGKAPTMRTLEKLCRGLDLRLTTLMRGLECGGVLPPAEELVDLIELQPLDVQVMASVVLREFFSLVDRRENAQ